MSNYNPYFFFDSPLPTEKIQYLMIELSKIKDDINFMKNAINKINEVLTEFEKSVREEVIKAVQKMYDSGELKEIITNIIDPYVKESINFNFAKNYELMAKHDFRTIHYTGQHWSRFSAGTTTQYNGMCVCQGGCSFTKGADNYFAECLHDINGEQGLLMIYRENNSKVEWKSFPLQSGHTQSCTYGEQSHCLFVPKFNDNGIYRFNIDTNENTLNQISPPNHSNGRWYSIKTVIEDGKEQLYGFYNNGVGPDNRLSVEISKIDYEAKTAELMDVVKLPELTPTKDGGYDTMILANCAINNRYIFLVSGRPNGVYVYDRTPNGKTFVENRNHLFFYKIPNVLNNCYPTAEIEDFSVDNDMNFDLVTMDELHGWNYYPAHINISQVIRHYSGNLIKGIYNSMTNNMQEVSPGDVYYNWSDRNTAIHISWDTLNGNPLGTKNQPFQCVQEAISFIENSNIFGCYIILDTEDYTPAFINTSKKIHINLNEKTLCGMLCFASDVAISNGSMTQTCNYYTKEQNAPIILRGNSHLSAYELRIERLGDIFRGTECDNNIYARNSNGEVIQCTNYQGGDMIINQATSYLYTRN